MGKISVVRTAAKGEFQHLHAGIACAVQHLVYLFGKEAKILRNDIQLSQAPVHRLEQLHIRALAPMTLPCVLSAVGYTVIALEATEMVYPDRVVYLKSGAYPADPPAVLVLSHIVPAVQGVAPQLTGLGEIIRGHARDELGDARLGELEQLPVGPHVHAVVGHVDGDISDEADALLVGVGPQGLPLAVEAVLDEGVIVDLLPEQLPIPGHGLRLPVPDILRPVDPAFALKMILQGAEQRPVLQIPGVSRHVLGHLGPIEPGEGLFQHLATAHVQEAEIHLPGILAPVLADVLIGEEPLLLQKIQIHQIGVPGEGGRALVGGIPEARGRQGQQLPIPLPGPMEVVHKVKGRLAQGAHPVGGRKAGDV